MITPAKVIITLPADPDGYYVLWYDAATKKIKSCRFVEGVTTSPDTTEGYATWAEIQARASELQLTGLPAVDPAIKNA